MAVVGLRATTAEIGGRFRMTAGAWEICAFLVVAEQRKTGCEREGAGLVGSQNNEVVSVDENCHQP